MTDFLARIHNELSATVHAVNRLTPTIVEVVVRSPLAARQFRPGQFYRLQNFEANALRTTPSPLRGEGWGEGSQHSDSPKNTAQARRLRKDMTDVERKLWFLLRDRRFESHKFRRQKPIGPFIADFVCAEANLIVELDGGQHDRQAEYDARRTAYLAQQGYRVLRFWNNEVVENTEGVMLRISEALTASKPLTPTLSPEGRGSISTTFAMEGIALTGAWVDPAQGLLGTIVLEMGGSSDLCALLKPGEPVILMGPTGTPTEIHGNETVLLVGGGLGNAVLFSIGKALREAGSKVLYFAGYKKIIDRYKVEDIEAAADTVIWACDEAPGFTPSRKQDAALTGNIVQAMLAYAQGGLGQGPALKDVTRLIAIGSDRMMAAVTEARRAVLAPYLNPRHMAIGSINSPMQCMMKEICAQCLQRHVDPVTGKETLVYSCFNQDQPLDSVDWTHLSARLSQNGAQEKLSAQWIGHCIKNASFPR